MKYADRIDQPINPEDFLALLDEVCSPMTKDGNEKPFSFSATLSVSQVEIEVNRNNLGRIQNVQGSRKVSLSSYTFYFTDAADYADKCHILAIRQKGEILHALRIDDFQLPSSEPLLTVLKKIKPNFDISYKPNLFNDIQEAELLKHLESIAHVNSKQTQNTSSLQQLQAEREQFLQQQQQQRQQERAQFLQQRQQERQQFQQQQAPTHSNQMPKASSRRQYRVNWKAFAVLGTIGGLIAANLFALPMPLVWAGVGLINGLFMAGLRQQYMMSTTTEYMRPTDIQNVKSEGVKIALQEGLKAQSNVDFACSFIPNSRAKFYGYAYNNAFNSGMRAGMEQNIEVIQAIKQLKLK